MKNRFKSAIITCICLAAMSPVPVFAQGHGENSGHASSSTGVSNGASKGGHGGNQGENGNQGNGNHQSGSDSQSSVSNSVYGSVYDSKHPHGKGPVGPSINPTQVLNQLLKASGEIGAGESNNPVPKGTNLGHGISKADKAAIEQALKKYRSDVQAEHKSDAVLKKEIGQFTSLIARAHAANLDTLVQTDAASLQTIMSTLQTALASTVGTAGVGSGTTSRPTVQQILASIQAADTKVKSVTSALSTASQSLLALSSSLAAAIGQSSVGGSVYGNVYGSVYGSVYDGVYGSEEVSVDISVVPNPINHK